MTKRWNFVGLFFTLNKKVVTNKMTACEKQKNLAASLNQIGGNDNLLEAKKLRKELSDMLGTDERP